MKLFSVGAAVISSSGTDLDGEWHPSSSKCFPVLNSALFSLAWICLHLFDLLKEWTPELLRIPCFPHSVALPPMCHFPKHSPWDTEAMDKHRECYLLLWVAVVGGIVTVLPLVQFLIYSVVSKNSVPDYFCSRLLQISDIQWKRKLKCVCWWLHSSNVYSKLIYFGFPELKLLSSCLFLFLNRKLFLPESLMHKQNNVSCKTKQTLPIRLPLWGSVQCWYFHASVFQNLKGNNRRLCGWRLAGKTTKSLLLLDNMTCVVPLIVFSKHTVPNCSLFLLKWHQILNVQLKK